MLSGWQVAGHFERKGAQLIDNAQIANWREEYRSDKGGATVLRGLAQLDRNPRRAAELERLARLEEAQADYWAEKLRAAGEPLPEIRPSRRARLVLALARRLGVYSVLPLVRAAAMRGVAEKRANPDAAPLVESELAVARGALALEQSDVASTAEALGREHRRRTGGNGSLRAAVFGVNDGLVSNLSLIMGVAGAQPSNQFILLAGLAGLLAGAFSMGGGEFISMLAQRELFQRQIDLEKVHIETMPAGERAVLTKRYEEKGLSRRQAETVADRILANPDVALDTIAREELGLDPDDLGSPQAAAGASFLSFVAGAIIPLLPFLLTSGWLAVILSGALSAVGLFAVGALTSLFTGRNLVYSGVRMVLVGGAAATVTFLIGRLIGVSVGG